MRERGGSTIAETLWALLLLLITLGLAWEVTARAGRSAAAMAEAGESLAASRAAAWILQEELEGVRAPDDVSAPAGDSFSIRGFRGAAVVCGAPAAAQLLVRWSGVRAPDPTKDSVLVLRGDGSGAVRGLVARVAAARGCSDGPAERWTLDAPEPAAALLRFFERGSYHLSDEALRYRIGRGGRQPLTPPALDPAGSGIVASGPGRIAVRLALRGSRSRRAGPAELRTFWLPGGW